MGNGVLSNKDISEELGKSIFIYPFKEENLKGSTYNLTASLCAWIVKDNKKQLIVNRERIIEIPPGETALIETNESIYVSNNISGTYHSRVSLCSKGLGHIGTTLDPCYFGTSVIALHNNNNKSVKIKPNESIVSIMFYDMKSGANKLHDNYPFRKDLFDLNIESFYEEYWKTSNDICPKCMECSENNNCQYKVTKNDKYIENEKKIIINELEEWKKASWRTNRISLEKIVKEYVFKRDSQKNIFRHSIVTIGIGAVLMVCLISILCILGAKNSEKNKTIIDILKVVIGIIPPTVTIIIGMIIRYHKKGEL